MFDDLGACERMMTSEFIRFDDLEVLKEQLWSFARLLTDLIGLT